MVDIGLSIMEGKAGDSEQLRPLLDTFEQQYQIHVNLTGINWVDGWSEVAKFGIYGYGPDVSSLGTTWVGSLAAVQTLRPFASQEIRALGGAEAFFEPIWRTGFLPNDSTLWAVPWLGDVMLIYCWEKALQKAGISDCEAAFSTDAALVQALEKLQKSGVEYPLAINLKSDSIILHEAAHWVWNAGGDFVSADGRQVIFNQQPALQGLRNYFKLRPFISPELLGATLTQDLFNTGKAAVHFAGPWLENYTQNSDWGGDIPCVNAIPGTTFAGGSSLVIWQYTSHPEEASKLVHFLATQPDQTPTSIYHHDGPTRCEAIYAPLGENDGFHRAYLQSVQRGRSFPSIRLWGAMEDKLRAGLSAIWTDLFANPNQDLDACIHKHIDPLAARLNMILKN